VVDSTSSKAWRKSMQNVTNSSIDFDEALQRAEDRRLSSLKRQLQRECVLLPSSRPVYAWRALIVPLIFWTVTVAPLQLALSWWKAGTWMDVLWVFVDVFFIVDMVFSVFVAPFHSGTLKISFRYRLRSYLKTWFIVDAVANFPWGIVIQGNEAKSRKLVKLLKLPKVFRVIRLLRVFREGAHYFGTVYTLVGVLLVVHYVACFWIWALIDCKDAVTLWHVESRDNVECPDPVNAYANALLVAIGTFRGADSWLQFTVDSDWEIPEDAIASFEWRGDPSAEITVAIISVVECVLLAVLFANVARSLGDQDEHTRQFHRRLENLRRTDEQKGLDKKLYTRVKKHYHYLWSCGNQWGAEVMHDEALTNDLRRELALSLYGEHLRTVPFLAAVDEVFLKQLCSCVVLECFSPRDFIISAGEFGTDLYFLVIGQVRIQAPGSKETLRTLVPGSFFGEMGLLVPDSHRVVDVVALTHGWMLSIGRESLQQICSEELLETFCSVAMERYLAQDANGVELHPKVTTEGGFRSVRRSSQVFGQSAPQMHPHLQGVRRAPSRGKGHGGPRGSHGASAWTQQPSVEEQRLGSKDAWPRSRASSSAKVDDGLQVHMLELIHTVTKRFDKLEHRLGSMEGLLTSLGWARRAVEDDHDPGKLSRTFSGTVGTVTN